MTSKEFKILVKMHLESTIADVFVEAHSEMGTKGGDMTPEQQLRLDKLIEELSNLIIEQTMQNIS